jgi:hypothetical protein
MRDAMLCSAGAFTRSRQLPVVQRRRECSKPVSKAEAPPLPATARNQATLAPCASARSAASNPKRRDGSQPKRSAPAGAGCVGAVAGATAPASLASAAAASPL